ncbi:hypothetical protein [Roseivivax marinus]|uniref:hypothetical protein n=1 Tax=Roseivivax marinus TaxID=1379903 RepID=UPI00273F5159|nr:hypothetical protein [Roseivivax marinus]
MTSTPLPDISVAECAQHFAFSPRTVYSMIESGGLLGEKFGEYSIAWEDVWECEAGPAPRPEMQGRYRTPLLTRKSLAALTGKSLRSVDRWLASGLPTRNVRRSVRINAMDAAEWLSIRYGSTIPLRLLRSHGCEPAEVQK